MTARGETPMTSQCFLIEPTPSHPSQESPEERHLAAAASPPDY